MPVPFCWAACGDRASGGADLYQVTVTKVEVTTDGTNFITIFSGSKNIDIAAANAGAVAGSLASGVALPPGTYTTVRVTLGATLQARGYINIGGNTQYTDGGTDAGAFSANVGVENTPGADCGISTFTIPEANRVSNQSVTIVVPASGSAPTVKIAFDTAGVIINNGGNPSLGAPTVTMSAS